MIFLMRGNSQLFFFFFLAGGGFWGVTFLVIPGQMGLMVRCEGPGYRGWPFGTVGESRATLAAGAQNDLPGSNVRFFF